MDKKEALYILKDLYEDIIDNQGSYIEFIDYGQLCALEVAIKELENNIKINYKS